MRKLAAAFVIEDTITSPYAHSAKDTMATLNLAHIMEHAKVHFMCIMLTERQLTLGFMVEGHISKDGWGSPYGARCLHPRGVI
jgi:hypothetical protein